MEAMEPFDLPMVTSAMLEREDLWKRVSESAVLGEASALGKAECRLLLYFVRIVVLFNVCGRCVLRNYVLLQSAAQL